MGRIRYRNKIGNGVTGDETDDIIFVPNSNPALNQNSAWTVEGFWKTPATVPSFWDFLYIRYGFQSQAIGARMRASDFSLVTSGATIAFIPFEWQADTLYHYACGKRASVGATSEYFAYVNKVLIGTTTINNPTFSVAQGVSEMRTGYEHFRPGLIGTYYGLRVYTKELNQSEIDFAFENNAPAATAESDCHLDLRFNQTRGNDVLDMSGNGFHGELLNFGSTTNYGGGALVDELGNIAI